MKNILFGLSILVMLTITSCATTQPVNSMFNDLKQDDQSMALTLPGWLIRKGFKLATKGEGIKEEDLVKLDNISGGIKKLRVLVNPNSDRDVKSFSKKYMPKLERDGFETYAVIKNKDANVVIMAQEKRSNLKGLLFFFNTDSEVGIVHLKTDIPFEEFQEIDFSFNQFKKEVKQDNKEVQ